jgi:hypothetical protein
MVKKLMNNFVVEIWKKFDLDTDILIHTSYQFSSSQIMCLHRQKILPGDSKNSTVDGQSQLIPCGHD